MSSDPNASSSLESAVLLLAIAALLTACGRGVGRVHRRRMRSRSGAHAQEVQTWEGEGGRPVEHPQPAPATR